MFAKFGSTHNENNLGFNHYSTDDCFWVFSKKLPQATSLVYQRFEDSIRIPDPVQVTQVGGWFKHSTHLEKYDQTAELWSFPYGLG